jgi:hypothetical protein
VPIIRADFPDFRQLRLDTGQCDAGNPSPSSESEAIFASSNPFTLSAFPDTSTQSRTLRRRFSQPVRSVRAVDGMNVFAFNSLA